MKIELKMFFIYSVSYLHLALFEKNLIFLIYFIYFHNYNSYNSFFNNQVTEEWMKFGYRCQQWHHIENMLSIPIYLNVT